jgi:integrase
MDINQKAVEKLKAAKDRVQVLDDSMTGFGLRVQGAAEGGKISYFWRAKMDGKNYFKTLGQHPAMNAKDAREAAKVWAGKASAWKQAGYPEEKNPFAKLVKPKLVEAAACPTFHQLCEAYIANHIKPQFNPKKPERTEKAEYNVRWLMGRRKVNGVFVDWSDYVKQNPKVKTPSLAAWLDRPMDSIIDEDVLRIKNAWGEKRYMANRVIEFVRALYNWSNDKHDNKINFWPVAANPAKDIDSFKEKSRKRFLKPAELRRFNQCLKTETHADLKDFLILAINTGARRSDIFAMRWDDIEWERKTWQVPFPKNDESYTVQLLPAALAVLERRRSEAADSDGCVFMGVGKRGHLLDLKQQWKDFRKRANLPDVHMHDLRRTVGAYAAMSGVNLQTIKEQLGHKSLQSTLIYAPLIDEAVRDANERGQAKMIEMMAHAAKREKLPTPKKPARAALSA